MRPIYTLAVLGVIIAHSTCQAGKRMPYRGKGSFYKCRWFLSQGTMESHEYGISVGFYYKIYDGDGVDDCGGTVSGGGFTATDCTHFLDAQEYVHFSSDNSFDWIEKEALPLTCNSVSTATIDGSASVTGATLSPVDDDVFAELEISISSGTVGVGDTVTIITSISSVSQNYYLMRVTTVTIEGESWQTRDIISGGCAVSPDTSSISITGDAAIGYGSTSVTIEYPAFLFFDDRDTTGPVTYDIEVTAAICSGDDANCFDSTACDGAGNLGRKRRQVTDEKTAKVNGTITVFPNQESRQRFMDSMRAELGITDATRITSLDDICVPKTTSVAVLVILIAGMVLCFVATVWMFVKLRKSRRLQDPDKADFAYSNKSFKR